MKYVCILFLLLFFYSVRGNNIRVEGKTHVIEFIGNEAAVLEVHLRWDNSWRDDFNWDAAWLFFKYKKRGLEGGWHPLYLSEEGHEFFPANDNEGGGYLLMAGGSISSGKVPGVYVMRDGISEGRVSIRLRLRVRLDASGLTRADFGEDNDQVYLSVHGIEMVFIPYGMYPLGDGYSEKSFVTSSKTPVLVDSEEALTVYTLPSSAQAVSLKPSYPKGYGGFYVMKYEVSQEQYVEFLNSLELEEQKLRVENNNFDEMKRGDYIFGSREKPDCRNGIAFISYKGGNHPALFGNNLNKENEFFSPDDGQTLACNYLCIEDLLAYCSWSGLRPLSEPEYEKCCRRPYPQAPEPGEYAWNSSKSLNKLDSEKELVGLRTEEERLRVPGKNVNSGLANDVKGPVRCGLFTTVSSTQMEAGATYWGVMEMGGNVKELCVNVKYAEFDGKIQGEGANHPELWSNKADYYGVRGGGFDSDDPLLRTSDRSEAERYFRTAVDRDSTVGFRCAGVVSNSHLPLSAGTISLSGPICPGSTITVQDVTAASTSSGLPLSYIWYVKAGSGAWVKLPGEEGGSVQYNSFQVNTAYQFKRKVVCALGEKEAVTGSVTTLIPPAITSQPRNTNSLCGLTLSVSASGSGTLSYQWLKNGNPISGATSASYNQLFASTGSYACRVTGTCGNAVSNAVQINIKEKYRTGQLVDPRDGQVYKTRILPDGREWMVENLRFGKCNAATFNTYHRKSVQNSIANGYWGVCMASPQPGGGNLYNWQAAINRPNAYYGSAVNPPGNVNGNSNNQWQGICPPGWHLPSGGSTGEFQKLYKALGSNVAEFYPGCLSFAGILGGSGYNAAVVYGGTYGYYWTSTFNNANMAFNFYFNATFLEPYKGATDKFYGFAVRCIRNY